MPYTGSLALRLVGAEELLCGSAAFRSHVGGGSPEETKAKVRMGELTDLLATLDAGQTLDVARPCAIVGVERHDYGQIGQGSLNLLGASGGVWVMFVDNPQQPTDHKRSLLAFVDWVSQVTDEIGVGLADSDAWPFRRLVSFMEPFRPDLVDRQTDDFWLMGYVFSDSIDGGGG